MYRKCNTIGGAMKSATIPPLRVTQELRQAVEGVLKVDESLSSFVESALVKQIEFRKMQKEFIARGLAAREASKQSGKYIGKEKSLAALDVILDKYHSSQ
ncbi:YlcI/YnfO family protein [Acidithiobacillus sulfurivorans]|nr:YlcI/YnfO family protein [Acidithiobacillus sulfurivorans]